MNLATPSAELHRFDLQRIPSETWRNGGGLTRQIASGRSGRATASSSDWDWRMSVADITAPAIFSAFPGVDRSAALVEGRGLALVSRDNVLVFHRPGDLHVFAGETEIESTLSRGPVRLFNVMVRRERAVATLQVHHADTSIELHRDRQHVLLAAQGGFRLTVRRHHSTPPAAGMLFHAAEGLRLSGTSARLAIEPLSPDSCLLHAEVRAC